MKDIRTNIYKSIMVLSLVLGMVFILSGCEYSKSNKDEDNTPKVYYLSREENGLEKEEYNQDKYGAPSVEGYIKALSDIPSDADSKRVLGGSVLIIKYELVEGCLKINYNDEYLNLDKTQEVLFRASMVKTLCQLPEVTSVSFFVVGEPLCDSNKEPYRSFKLEDFVDVDD